jgi:hypothetical protein
VVGAEKGKQVADKLYSVRDAQAQGQCYVDHVLAMTAEDLHAKCDIAAELAHRDIEIITLRAELAQCKADAERWQTLCALVLDDRVRVFLPDGFRNIKVDAMPDQITEFIDAARAKHDLPEGTLTIGDYIAKQEQVPERRAAIEAARVERTKG